MSRQIITASCMARQSAVDAVGYRGGANLSDAAVPLQVPSRVLLASVTSACCLLD
jgi:hypothetical protein